MGEFQHFIRSHAVSAGEAEVALPDIAGPIDQKSKARAVGAAASVWRAFSIFTGWSQSKHILCAAYNAIGISSARRPVVVICDPGIAPFIESDKSGAVHLLAVAVVTQCYSPGIRYIL